MGPCGVVLFPRTCEQNLLPTSPVPHLLPPFSLIMQLLDNMMGQGRQKKIVSKLIKEGKEESKGRENGEGKKTKIYGMCTISHAVAPVSRLTYISNSPKDSHRVLLFY